MLSALQEEVKSRMLIIRNKQVILDSDVAKLYGIETKAVNQAVKRNADKFPSDYMFHLEKEDVEHLRSQNVTANISAKSRFLPVAFTEKGLYMLATILKSPKATDATFAIIETFAAVRELKRELINLHKETDPITIQIQFVISIIQTNLIIKKYTKFSIISEIKSVHSQILL